LAVYSSPVPAFSLKYFSNFPVSDNRVDGAFRFTNTAINALIRVDDEHVFAFIETVDGTNFDTIHELAFDAFVLDDIGHAALAPNLRLRRPILRLRRDVTDKTAAVNHWLLKSFI